MKREIFYFYIIKSSSNIIPAIGLHNYILQGNATCMLWSRIDLESDNPCVEQDRIHVSAGGILGLSE